MRADIWNGFFGLIKQGQDSQSFEFHKRHILLVDDSRDFCYNPFNSSRSLQKIFRKKYMSFNKVIFNTAVS